MSAALLKQAPRISPEAIQMALTALERLKASGAPVRSDVLTVIDYTKPSTEPRLWVFDLKHARVLFEELVAHGRNSGDNRAVRFSNEPGSLMSSLGVFLTGDTYIGKHGLSLRLRGMERGVNDKSMERAIVIHAANYVSERVGTREGRIGRSWGCPAVSARDLAAIDRNRTGWRPPARLLSREILAPDVAIHRSEELREACPMAKVPPA